MSRPLPPTPDLRWYSETSDRRGVSVRCPFATVETCPRYYQSLSLLGQAGSTEIPKEEDERLLAHWKLSSLWPRTDEQATSVLGADGDPFAFSNYCPEVLYERFGYFATYLAHFSDQIDRDAAHTQLSSLQAPAGHPNWNWQSIREQHFTECPIYAVLLARPPAVQAQPTVPASPWWRKHIAEIGTAIAVALIGLLAKCAG